MDDEQLEEKIKKIVGEKRFEDKKEEGREWYETMVQNDDALLLLSIFITVLLFFLGGALGVF